MFVFAVSIILSTVVGHSAITSMLFFFYCTNPRKPIQ